jgi:eukaryotic-like serine/threonine-protein kinase
MTDPKPEITQPPSSQPLKLPAVSELGLPAEIEVLENIGFGGMGVVYKAKNRKTGADLAVKMLLPDQARDHIAVQRLMREGQAMMKLSDPHIAKVFDCGTSSTGIPYMLMEFAPGLPLDKCLVNGGPVSYPECEQVLRQCASAIAHAHRQGIIHRDLKPANIMVNMEDNGGFSVKLLDFGISKFVEDNENAVRLTDTGQVLGTPLYMSPEQVVGEKLDCRADIYALGCVIFEALAGEPPFFATDAYKLLAQHLRDETPDLTRFRPDIPQGLKRIVERMMEKRREDRYATMDELLKDLDALHGPRGVPQRLTGRQRQILKICLDSVVIMVITFALTYVILLVAHNFGGNH